MIRRRKDIELNVIDQRGNTRVIDSTHESINSHNHDITDDHLQHMEPIETNITRSNEHHEDIELSWIFKNSIILKNTSSIARDQLANERTLLAWIRTSAVFLTLSITFLQFVNLSLKSNTAINLDGSKYDISSITSVSSPIFEKYAKPIVTLGMVFSLVSVIFGGFRYFTVQQMLIRDYFPLSRVIIVIMVSINVTLVTLLLVLEVKITS